MSTSLPLNFRLPECCISWWHHSFTSSSFLDWVAFVTMRRPLPLPFIHLSTHDVIFHWICASHVLAMQKCKGRCEKRAQTRVACNRQKEVGLSARKSKPLTPPITPWQLFQCCTMFSKHEDQSYSIFLLPWSILDFNLSFLCLCYSL